MKYVVEITEKLVTHVVVEADSADEAENIVEQAHIDGKINLDYSDYDGVDCECLREADEDDVKDYVNVEDL